MLSKDIHHMKYRMGTMGTVDKVIVCYDGIYGRRPRGKIYKMYKAHKSGIRADKHKGHDVRKVIEECGYDPMAIDDLWEGVYDEYKEADDLIAEQVLEYSNKGAEIVIISEDRDMLQMLSWKGNIRLHNFKEEITKDIFQSKWNIDPTQFVDWKCLAGDVSDNITGLKGVGSKKASKLLKEYGNIENLPPDYTIGYKPIDKQLISSALVQFQEINNHSTNKCRLLCGTSWGSLISMTKKGNIKYSDAQRLFEAMPHIEPYFKIKSYVSTLKKWKQLIELPFQP